MGGRIVVLGHYETLQAMYAYCEQKLVRQYGPEEGERRLKKLTLLSALRMWRQRTMN
jgi:hypothetical protein